MVRLPVTQYSCFSTGGDAAGEPASGSASGSGSWRWAAAGAHGGAVQAVDWHPSQPAVLSSAADRSVHVTLLPAHSLDL